MFKPGQITPDFAVDAGYKYTGQREVSGLGLYYYGARYYDPAIGRFITEDSYQGDIESSLSQNRYIYVLDTHMRIL